MRLHLAQPGATAAILLDGKRPSEWIREVRPDEVAEWLGVDRNGDGLVSWDVFEGVLTPGDVLAMMTWRTNQAAETFERHHVLKDGVRLRLVRVVRDYSMFDRREATQYYPEVARTSDTTSSPSPAGPQVSPDGHRVDILPSDTHHS